MKLDIQYFANEDGVVVISTDLKTAKLEAKLKKLENDLKDTEKQFGDMDIEQLNLEEAFEEAGKSTEKYREQLQKSQAELDKLIAKAEELKAKLRDPNYAFKGVASSSLELVESQIENIKFEMGMINDSAKESELEQGKISREIDEQNVKLEKQKSKISNIKDQIELTKFEIKEASSNANNIENKIDGIGKAMSKTAKKAIRWGLAIFGIRSAYLAIRQAMNTISQYDTQLAADIEYIKNALAFALEPVVRTIVDLIKKLLSYIGYIIYVWTGKDIFENANKSLKKANGEAKKLQKTLASFDEMNIIGDNTTAAGGGVSGSGIKRPEDGDVPKWLKWIALHGPEIIAILAGITAGLIALKLGFTGIQSLGIGIAVGGIVYAVQSLLKFLKDKTWQNFIDILKGIAIAVAGVAIAFAAWPVALVAALVAVVLEITKYFDKIMGLFTKLQTWIETKVFNKLKNDFGIFGAYIATELSRAVAMFKGLFEGFFGGIKKQAQGVVKFFKGDFKGGIKDVFLGLKSVFLAPLNSFVEGINVLIKGINKIKFDVPNWVPVIGGKKWGFNLPQIPKLAKGGIVNLPGRGVPIGNAYTGEAGREGVIPLTDSQQMSLLGEAIGKYIRIDNVIDVNMDSRKIKRIMATSDSRDRMVGNG